MGLDIIINGEMVEEGDIQTKGWDIENLPASSMLVNVFEVFEQISLRFGALHSIK